MQIQIESKPHNLQDNQLAIKVQNLGKCYRIFDSPRARLLQSLWGSRHQLYREFWALQNVSFELNRGETLGVVGRNGSGKSTLLQLICGTLTPSTGSVYVNGRIGALLELGSGFNPEFSGRENIYLNGAILGLSNQQIDERLDDILAFADIGEFVEEPVKTYSSGMAVRLAFAVQAFIDPDILIVDEALAVGDELFQRKCYNRLERLKQNGTAILLVTHSCPQIIQHCDTAVLIHHGKLRMWDQPQRVTTMYQQLANASDEQWNLVLPESACIKRGSETASAHEVKHRWQEPELKPETSVIHTSYGAEITDLQIETDQGQVSNHILFGDPFQLRFRYRASKAFDSLQFGCHVASVSGQRITGAVYPTQTGEGTSIQAGEQWEIVFPFSRGLMPGTYFIGGGIWETQDSGSFIHRVVDYRAIKVMATGAEVLIGLCDLSSGPPQFC